MKKGCPICLPGPNNACPAHKGGPGRNKRKRIKKLNYEINNKRNRQAKQAESPILKRYCPDCVPGPSGACPAHKGRPGRNKRKKLKKPNYEANNERNSQAKIASERNLDILEGRLPRSAGLQGQAQQPFPDLDIPPDTASTPGAQNAATGCVRQYLNQQATQELPFAALTVFAALDDAPPHDSDFSSPDLDDSNEDSGLDADESDYDKALERGSNKEEWGQDNIEKMQHHANQESSTQQPVDIESLPIRSKKG
jgi:hypothetical protein